jgi:hydroxymethylbilane synthase
MKIKIGTRESNLALKQTNIVIDAIKKYMNIDCEIVTYKTTGDKILDKNLYDIGGKGLFLKEIEEALIKDEIDIAVHSYKDVPGTTDSRLEIKALLEREDPFDVLLSYKAKSIMELPKNSTLGTCSPRRKVQVLKIRPDINVIEIRGNVETRIKKLTEGHLDSVILAGAGLQRLNLFNSAFCSYIDPDIMVPAVGQGVISIQVKTDRKDLDHIFQNINHLNTYTLSFIERQFLENLNADCNSPVGCFARIKDDIIFVDFMFADYNLNFFEKENISFPLDKYNDFKEIGKIMAKRMLEKTQFLK